MNKVIVKGRLGADVEVKNTQNGKHVARMRVAVDRRGKDTTADWFDVICWEKTADFASQYLGKGRAVLVEGRLQSRTYEKDGQKRSVVEIIAENIEFADSKPEQAAPKAQAPTQVAPQAPAQPTAPAAPAPAANTVTDDDIPF